MRAILKGELNEEMEWTEKENGMGLEKVSFAAHESAGGARHLTAMHTRGWGVGSCMGREQHNRSERRVTGKRTC